MRYKFGGLIFGGAYFRNFTVFLFPSFSFFFLGGGGGMLRVLGQGLNQSARIFFIRAFSGCYVILRIPKKGETAVYGYNPALF